MPRETRMASPVSFIRLLARPSVAILVNNFIAKRLEPFPSGLRGIIEVKIFACRTVEHRPTKRPSECCNCSNRITPTPHVQHHVFDGIILADAKFNREAITFEDSPGCIGPIDSWKVARQLLAHFGRRTKRDKIIILYLFDRRGRFTSEVENHDVP